jgi:hypothetical protein
METKKAKKKKKKKKRKSTVSEDEGNKEDEVITISYSEQKKAAETATEMDEKESPLKKDKKKKTKSKKTPEKTPKEIELTSEQKRVRFGRANHSKSHTASMKALKTMEQPELKSPSRGILRSKSPSGKEQSAADSSKKKSRKRAMAYF